MVLNYEEQKRAEGTGIVERHRSAEDLHRPAVSTATSSLPLNQSIALSSVYVLTSVGYFLVIRRQGNKGVVFHPALLVFSVELCKLVVCLIAYHLEHGQSMLTRLFCGGDSGSIRSSISLWKSGIAFAVPSFIYAVYNNLTYFNLKMVDPGTFQVFMQCKTLFSGVLFTLFFKRFLSLRQWSALMLVMVGIASKFVVGPTNSKEGIRTSSISFFALFTVLLQGFLSAFAGVYNEYSFKKDMALSIHIQNFFMYFYALFFNLVIAMYSVGLSSIEYSVLTRPPFLLIVLLGATTGLAAAFLLKFINVIVKGLAAAIEVIITTLATGLLLAEPLTTMDFVAAALVTYAVYVYNSKGLGDAKLIRCGL